MAGGRSFGYADRWPKRRRRLHAPHASRRGWPSASTGLRNPVLAGTVSRRRGRGPLPIAMPSVNGVYGSPGQDKISPACEARSARDLGGHSVAAIGACCRAAKPVSPGPTRISSRDPNCDTTCPSRSAIGSVIRGETNWYFLVNALPVPSAHCSRQPRLTQGNL